MINKELLKSISSITSGSAAPKENQFSNDGLPFIRAGHLKDLIEDASSIEKLPKVSDEMALSLRLKKIEPGTILFAKSGMSSTKNRVYLCKSEAYIVSHLAAVKPNEEIIKCNYLKYFLEWYKPSQLIVDESYPSIRISDIGDIEIEIPSIDKQNLIIKVLDNIKQLVKLRKLQITALDELTQSLFLEMFGDPIVNPKNIITKKLGGTGELKRGMSKHRPRNAPELLGGPYPLIQTGDVSKAGLYIERYKSTYSELGLKQSKMWEAGTLCITIAANIAETSILKFDACFPDSVVGYKPNEQMNIVFVHYWFSFLQKIIERNAPESAQKNINLKILNDLEILQPPIEKQNEFANKVLEIDRQKSQLLKAGNSIEDLYNSLLQKAFKGELFQEQEPYLTKEMSKR